MKIEEKVLLNYFPSTPSTFEAGLLQDFSSAPSPSSGIVNVLGQVEEWVGSQADLVNWAPVLNVIDDFLRRCAVQLAESNEILVPFMVKQDNKSSNTTSDGSNETTGGDAKMEDEDVDKESKDAREEKAVEEPMKVAKACLMFTRLLLRNARRKTIYRSFERVAPYLAVEDEDIVDCVLEILTEVATPTKLYVHPEDFDEAEFARINDMNDLSKTLMCFAQGWGSRAQGFDLRRCVLEESNSPLLPETGKEVHFEFFRLNDSNTKRSSDNKDEKEGMVKIWVKVEDQVLRQGPTKLFRQLVAEYNVPEAQQFALLQRILLAFSFTSLEGRIRRVRQRMLSLRVLLSVGSFANLMLVYFQNEPELTRELVTVLDERQFAILSDSNSSEPLVGNLPIKTPEPGSQNVVPLEIGIQALYVLEAMTRDRTEDAIGQIGRESGVLQALGAVVGDSHAVLLSFLRSTTSLLERHACRLKELLAIDDSPREVANEDLDLSLAITFAQATSSTASSTQSVAMPIDVDASQLDLTEDQYRWVEAILFVTNSIADIRSGAAALADAGLVHSLMSVLTSEVKLRQAIRSQVSPTLCWPRRTRIISLNLFVLDNAVETMTSSLRSIGSLGLVDLTIDLLESILRRAQVVSKASLGGDESVESGKNKIETTANEEEYEEQDDDEDDAEDENHSGSDRDSSEDEDDRSARRRRRHRTTTRQPFLRGSRRMEDEDEDAQGEDEDDEEEDEGQREHAEGHRAQGESASSASVSGEAAKKKKTPPSEPGYADMLVKGQRTIIRGALPVCDESLVYAATSLLITLHVSSGNTRMGAGGLGDRLRSPNSKLHRCLRCLFDNVDAFPGPTHSRALLLLSDVLNSDPVSAKSVYLSGLARASLRVVTEDKVPVVSYSIRHIPDLFRSLTLNRKATRLLKNKMSPNPVEKFVHLFHDLKYTRAIFDDCPSFVGRKLFEITQSSSSLRHAVLDALVSCLQALLKEMREPPADRSRELESAACSTEKEVTLIRQKALSNTLVMLATSLENTDRQKKFVERGGLKVLLELYPCTLPDDKVFLLRAGTESSSLVASENLTSTLFTLLGINRGGMMTIQQLIESLEERVDQVGTLKEQLSSAENKGEPILRSLVPDVTAESLRNKLQYDTAIGLFFSAGNEDPDVLAVQRVSPFFKALASAEWVCMLLSKCVMSGFPSNSVQMQPAWASELVAPARLAVLQKLAQTDRQLRWELAASFTVERKNSQQTDRKQTVRDLALGEVNRFCLNFRKLARNLSKLCSGPSSARARFMSGSDSPAELARKIAFEIKCITFDHLNLADQASGGDEAGQAFLMYTCSVFQIINSSVVEVRKSVVKPNVVLISTLHISEKEDEDMSSSSFSSSSSSSSSRPEVRAVSVLDMAIDKAFKVVDTICSLPSESERQFAAKFSEPIFSFLWNIISAKPRDPTSSKFAVLDSWPDFRELILSVKLKVLGELQTRIQNKTFLTLPDQSLTALVPVLSLLFSASLADEEMLPGKFGDESTTSRSNRSGSLGSFHRAGADGNRFRFASRARFEPDEDVVLQLEQTGFTVAHIRRGMNGLRTNDPNEIMEWLLTHPPLESEMIGSSSSSASSSAMVDEPEEDELALAMRLSLGESVATGNDGARETEETNEPKPMSDAEKREEQEKQAKREVEEQEQMASEETESLELNKLWREADQRRVVFVQFRALAIPFCVDMLLKRQIEASGAREKASSIVESLVVLLQNTQNYKQEAFAMIKTVQVLGPFTSLFLQYLQDNADSFAASNLSLGFRVLDKLVSEIVSEMKECRGQKDPPSAGKLALLSNYLQSADANTLIAVLLEKLETSSDPKTWSSAALLYVDQILEMEDSLCSLLKTDRTLPTSIGEKVVTVCRRLLLDCHASLDAVDLQTVLLLLGKLLQNFDLVKIFLSDRSDAKKVDMKVLGVLLTEFPARCRFAGHLTVVSLLIANVLEHPDSLRVSMASTLMSALKTCEEKTESRGTSPVRVKANQLMYVVEPMRRRNPTIFNQVLKAALVFYRVENGPSDTFVRLHPDASKNLQQMKATIPESPGSLSSSRLRDFLLKTTIDAFQTALEKLLSQKREENEQETKVSSKDWEDEGFLNAGHYLLLLKDIAEAQPWIAQTLLKVEASKALVSYRDDLWLTGMGLKRPVSNSLVGFLVEGLLASERKLPAKVLRNLSKSCFELLTVLTNHCLSESRRQVIGTLVGCLEALGSAVPSEKQPEGEHLINRMFALQNWSTLGRILPSNGALKGLRGTVLPKKGDVAWETIKMMHSKSMVKVLLRSISSVSIEHPLAPGVISNVLAFVSSLSKRSIVHHLRALVAKQKADNRARSASSNSVLSDEALEASQTLVGEMDMMLSAFAQRDPAENSVSEDNHEEPMQGIVAEVVAEEDEMRDDDEEVMSESDMDQDEEDEEDEDDEDDDEDEEGEDEDEDIEEEEEEDMEEEEEDALDRRTHEMFTHMISGGGIGTFGDEEDDDEEEEEDRDAGGNDMFIAMQDILNRLRDSDGISNLGVLDPFNILRVTNGNGVRGRPNALMGGLSGEQPSLNSFTLPDFESSLPSAPTANTGRSHSTRVHSLVVIQENGRLREISSSGRLGSRAGVWQDGPSSSEPTSSPAEYDITSLSLPGVHLSGGAGVLSSFSRQSQSRSRSRGRTFGTPEPSELAAELPLSSALSHPLLASQPSPSHFLPNVQQANVANRGDLFTNLPVGAQDQLTRWGGGNSRPDTALLETILSECESQVITEPDQVQPPHAIQEEDEENTATQQSTLENNDSTNAPAVEEVANNSTGGEETRPSGGAEEDQNVGSPMSVDESATSGGVSAVTEAVQPPQAPPVAPSSLEGEAGGDEDLDAAIQLSMQALSTNETNSSSNDQVTSETGDQGTASEQDQGETAPPAPSDNAEETAEISQGDEGEGEGASSSHGGGSELPLPPGVDPEVWASLPDEFRLEILREHGMSATSSSSSSSPSEQDAFLAAMPDDIRDEIIRSGGGAGAASVNEPPADPSNAEDMDPASFIASLEPELRREVLLSSEESVIAQLPSHLRAEAEILRQRHISQRHSHFRGARDRPSGTEEVAAEEEKPKDQMELETETEGKALVQKREVQTVARCLFLLQLPRVNTMKDVLANFCAHPKSRVLVLETLIKILAPRARAEFQWIPASMFGSPQDNSFALAATVTSSVISVNSQGKEMIQIPALVAKRALDVLNHLASSSKRVVFHLLVSGSGTKLQDAQNPSRTFETYSFPCLEEIFALLAMKEFSMSSVHLSAVVELLATILSPLSLLEADKDANNKKPVSAPSTSSTSSSSSSSSSQDESKEEKKDTSQESSKSKKDIVKVPRRVVAEDSLRHLADVLTLDTCTDATFSKATKVVQNLSKVQANRKGLLGELCRAAEKLGSRAVDDLEALHAILQSEGELEDSISGNSLAFASSSSETKLLRILKTVRGLSDSPEDLDRLCAGVELDALWKALSSCLSVVSLKTGSKELVDKESGETLGGVGASTSSSSAASESLSTGGARENENNKAMDSAKSTVLAFAHARLPIINAFFIVNGFTDTVKEKEKAKEEEERRNKALLAQQKRLAGGEAQDSAQHHEDTLGHHELIGEEVKEHPVQDKREAALVSFVHENGWILNELVTQLPTLLQGSFNCLLKNKNCRGVIDFDNKRAFFNTAMRSLRSNTRMPPIRLQVKRSHVFEESFLYLRHHTAEEMRGRLSITFADEPGIDAGGVTREWYEILAREMFKPGYALFKPSADSSAFQPDPRSYIVDQHLEYFKFVGRIVGKAIADRQLLPIHLVRSMYKTMLGRKVTPQDMQSIDPEYYRGLMELLQMDIEELGLELTFTAESEEFGVRKTRELIPGGANIPVTEKNKRDYIRLATQHRMTTGVQKQLDAFLEGFHELVPHDLIEIFDENELELLISGVPEIDLEDLKQNTEYVSFTTTSPQIKWFWKALESFSKEDHAKFVMFVTGTSKVPLDGFKSLQGMRGPQKFSIHKAYGGDKTLPMAHTCFNQLDLPEYSTYEILREKLFYAINEGGEGFGFG